MQFPQWNSYGKPNDANTLRFDIGPYTFWYSYKTLVAFRVPEHPMVICQNVWTNTTGKHLNLIDDKRPNERVDADMFNRLVKDLLEPHFGRMIP